MGFDGLELTPEEELVWSPRDLVIRVDHTSEDVPAGNMTMRNQSTERVVCYRIRTKDPGNYAVNEGKGFLSPGETKTAVIFPQKGTIAQNQQHRWIIQVCTTIDLCSLCY